MASPSLTDFAQPHKGGQYNSIDELIDSGQTLKEWVPDNLLRHSLIKAWKHSELCIELQWNIRVGFRHLKAGDYRAYLYAPIGIPFVAAQDNKRGSWSYGASHAAYGNHGREKGAMLIPIIDGLKLQEEFDARIFPMVVRLQRFDSSLHVYRHSYQRSSDAPPFAGSTCFLTATEQGELDSLLFAPCEWLTKRKRDVIERRTQIVRNLSDKQMDVFGERVHTDNALSPHLVTWVQAISLKLEYRSIEVRFHEEFSQCIGGFELFLRSINLGSCGVESGHDETLDDNEGVAS